MYWRPISEPDLEACLDIQPACIGDALTGREQALRIWRGLLDSPAFQGSVYESQHPIGGFRILGSIAAGDAAVLDRDALAAGNAGPGLDFVNLYGSWREGILDGDELAEIRTLLGVSFLESLAGFRFNRIIKEAIGAATIGLARATGSYRTVAEFPETEGALVVASPDTARDVPFSVAARMYRYQVPVLHLRPAEQSLLLAAVDGKTDAELSTCLGVSVEAVKKRWMSVFGRRDEFKPDILSGTDPHSARRGPQKRHRVLAYVRTHPEELRPYAW